MCLRAHGVRERTVLFQLALTWVASRCCWECGGNPEGSIDDFDEISFLAKNEPFCLSHSEVLSGFGVFLQTCPVGLIRRQTVESDQPRSNIIRSFVGKKIADKVSTAAGNNAAPILGVLLEGVALERINLIAYEASYRHRFLPGSRSGGRRT